jgi:RluA family pseudouridine synthase
MSTLTSKLYSKSVPKNLNDQRIDLALVSLFPDFTRSKLRWHIDNGTIFLNKKRIWIAKYQVKAGDLLEINDSQGDKKVIEWTDKNIIFENERFIVVNKPAGMVVEDTNHNYPILKAISEISNNFVENLRIVHRLDKETSGLILIAKSEYAQQALIKMWSEQKVEKTYQCICLNVPTKMQGSINMNIGQHAARNQYATNKKFSEGGKTALTLFKVIAVLQKGLACLISCQPKTGRSHQIRVHLSSLDCPIVGDKIYGSKYRNHPLYMLAHRQMLHASQLIFEYEDQKYNFHAPAPTDFNQMAKYIKTSPELKEKQVELSNKKAEKKREQRVGIKIKSKTSKRRTLAEKANRNAIFGGNKKKPTPVSSRKTQKPKRKLSQNSF